MNYFLTPKRFEELKQELDLLKKTKRLEIADKLRRVKELGDLSENSEYLETKEEQSRLERRIADLEEIVKNVKIIESKKASDKVTIGSTVEVLRNGKSLRFVIVGTNEAKPEGGFISNESPLGKELIDKKVGDTVIVETPGGKAEYKIAKLS
ncbi:MAG TPA: transcription elongation factor GreA [Candidatus Paceibacterota bacterium]